MTAVDRLKRTLRVDFEWSLTAPTRIVNLNSGQTTYRGKDGDAGMTGGTVAIRVPERGEVAYIAVEHRSGLVSVFEPAITKWFREHSPVEDFRLHLSGYVPEDFWRQFLENGTVLELNMERHVVPRDIADMATGDQDATRIADAGMTRVHVEVSEGARGPAKNWLQKKWGEITSNFQNDGSGVFLYQGEQYTKLKAKMSHQGVERTIVVGPEPDGRIAPAFPVDVAESSPGVADSTSLFQEMLALLDETLGD